MLLAAVFATLGRAYPTTGGPYAYAHRAFGDFAGFQTAWGYWIAAWAGNAAIAIAFTGYLTAFWPSLADSKGGTRRRMGQIDGVHVHPKRPPQAPAGQVQALTEPRQQMHAAPDEIPIPRYGSGRWRRGGSSRPGRRSPRCPAATRGPPARPC
jgi:Amino acid permease